MRPRRLLQTGLIAILLAACTGHSTTPTISPPPRLDGGVRPSGPEPTATPVEGTPSPPTGMVVNSFSFVGSNLGWVLGEVACPASPCLSLMRTTDGGHNWVGMPAPAARLDANLLSDGEGRDCVRSACVSQIRFATPTIGYAFGPSLFLTTDGGDSWRRQSSSPVVALATGGSSVVRIVSIDFGDQDLVQSSSAGADSWTTLAVPKEPWLQIVLARPRTLYLRGTAPAGMYPGGDLWRSLDGGTTWTHLTSPCSQRPFDATGKMAASGDVVGVLCFPQQIAPQQAGFRQGVSLSTDDGATFGRVQPIPRLIGPDAASAAEGLAIAPSTTLAVIGSEGGLQSSFDGGSTWLTGIPQRGAFPADGFGDATPEALDYESGTTGHAITPDSTLWTTTDAGRHWTSYTFARES